MPRRSNGCLSCKTRRVKCDEQQPSCQRCQKAGITCKGYMQPKFIDERPRVEHEIALSRTQQKDLEMGQKSNQLYHTHTKIQAPPPKISVELPLTAFRDTMIITFLMSKLFEGRLPRAHIQGREAEKAVWIQEAVRNSEPSHTLYSLAFIVFGQAHHEEKVIEDSRKLYGRGLRDLRGWLGDKGRMGSFNTLCCVTACCMYEILDRRTGPAWNFHAEGLSLLTRAGGPEKYQRFPEKSVFHDQRVMLLSKAIFLGQSTFLSEPEWKTIPWANDPSSKQPMDYLLDILSDTATYLAEISDHTSGMKINHLLELKARVQASIQELNNWWHCFINIHPNACWEISPDSRSGFTRDEEGLVFETVLEYGGLWIAYTVCTYDVTRILLLQTLKRIKEGENQYPYADNYGLSPRTTSTQSTTNVHQEEPDEPRTPLLGITSNIQGLAHEIFRSLEYCHLISQHYMGSYSCIFVPDIAFSSIDAESREAKWFWSKIQPMGEVNKSFSKGIKVLPCCQFKREYES